MLRLFLHIGRSPKKTSLSPNSGVTGRVVFSWTRLPKPRPCSFGFAVLSWPNGVFHPADFTLAKSNPPPFMGKLTRKLGCPSQNSGCTEPESNDQTTAWLENWSNRSCLLLLDSNYTPTLRKRNYTLVAPSPSVFFVFFVFRGGFHVTH